jgi:hypothetical protein
VNEISRATVSLLVSQTDEHSNKKMKLDAKRKEAAIKVIMDAGGTKEAAIYFLEQCSYDVNQAAILLAQDLKLKSMKLHEKSMSETDVVSPPDSMKLVKASIRLQKGMLSVLIFREFWFALACIIEILTQSLSSLLQIQILIIQIWKELQL